MRVIKFRAWSKTTKKLIYIDSFSGIPSNWKDIWELMQFTGLHDKNGKEIYEGDIVNVRNWGRTDEVLHTATIVWDTQMAAWTFDPWFDVDEYDRWRRIEVIGNRFKGVMDAAKDPQTGR